MLGAGFAEGTVHILAERSISECLALRTSAVRTHVKIANSSARAPIPCRPRNSAMNAGMSGYASEVWCLTARTLGRKQVVEMVAPSGRILAFAVA